MLIKSAADRTEDVAELNALLSEPKLTAAQKKRIEKEIHLLGKGAWGEDQAAYFLDFHFAGYKNSIILHDLRLVLRNNDKEKIAQIDHLIITRFLDVYVLESKNWKQLIVDEAGACSGKTWDGQEFGTQSPLEQCKRHVTVLARVFQLDPQLKALAPRQNIIPRVLVAPRCHLKAVHHREWYLKADAFHSAWEKDIDTEPVIQSVVSLTRMVSRDTLYKIGHALAELHNPGRANWREKFGLALASSEAACTAYDLVSSIEGLVKYVPEWGDDWFVLRTKPSEETKKILNRAGYRAKQENEDWVWRLKVRRS